MKKIATLLSILIFMGIELSAQSQFRFGFQLSPNFTWISNDNQAINGNGSNLGLKLGVIGERFFAANDSYSFSFGIGFAFNQGGTLQHDVGGDFWPNSLTETDVRRSLPDGVNLKYGIQYIEIPFGLKMRTQEFGYFRYYVEPGFTLGLKTQARGSVSSAGELNVDDLPIKKDVNFINLSWGIGGGVEYTIGESTAIIGGLSFQSGFLDITDNDAKTKPAGQEPVSEDSKASIKSLTVKLGVMF